MITTDYVVTGMTCGHCVSSVTQEVSALPTVSDVQVSLDDGLLRVTSDDPVPFDQIEAAVDEAGYSVAAR